MQNGEMHYIKEISNRKWFYEFELPNGTTTESDCSDSIKKLHIFRRKILHDTIQTHFGNQAINLCALDIGSHEGYYTLELANHFQSVQGIEKNKKSVDASKIIFDAYKMSNIEIICDDFLTLHPSQLKKSDMVLLYGVIYHLENPISVLRRAAELTSRALLIETQILNFDIEAKIDWGNYDSQKNVQGIFGVVSDDPESREGGITEIALVPSINALYSILKNLGFSTITKIKDTENTCEQFYRDRRAIILCIR